MSNQKDLPSEKVAWRVQIKITPKVKEKILEDAKNDERSAAKMIAQRLTEIYLRGEKG